LALLQAEESASVLELVNVPNVRWHFHILAGRQNKKSINLALSFISPSLAPNGWGLVKCRSLKRFLVPRYEATKKRGSFLIRWLPAFY